MPNMVDYEETRASFELDVPDRFNAAADIVDKRADTDPDRIALRMVSPDGLVADDYSFADLRDRSNQMGRFLAELATGADPKDVPFPMTRPKQIPLHFLRRPMLMAMVQAYRLRDRLDRI